VEEVGVAVYVVTQELGLTTEQAYEMEKKVA